MVISVFRLTDEDRSPRVDETGDSVTAIRSIFLAPEARGSEAIELCRQNDPTGYLRVISSVMPKHSEKTIKHDVANLSDSEILNLVKDVRDQLGTTASPGRAGTQDKDKARLN